ncbi:TetR/AcrR family transcriptional regulator [Paenibacillus nasutitermitis]|uniref:HTH-type transcriptional regulator YcnC n=1 Tax=Paenibacillus nasutitermitis TaxID=1652958 RepID=A0A916ZH28_9BACL|nr:helix-turn-helix domain-containing protein [Paenibacillus nasutitermitis]GGD97397.1 putative HTH-type transcriptional regulator YcnC [Paenibacillus nasutitermitis]
MSLLKQRIMDSAMRFFSEKGYVSTSIQDIANDCGIAKPSLYKFFSSKEDLLIEVYAFKIQDMYDQAEAIKANITLSPKDRFIRETLHQLEYFTELKFSIEENQVQSVQEKGKFISFCHCLRARQLNYYKDCLLTVYGGQIEACIWDLVAVYHGMMKEFTQFPNFVNQPLNLESAAIFIVARMEDMVVGILKTKLTPILQPSVIVEYVQHGLEGTPVPAAKNIEDLFRNLRSTVDELMVPITRKTELNEVAGLLQEETDKDQPKRMLIRTMLEFLQTQHELKNIVGQLDKLLG